MSSPPYGYAREKGGGGGGEGKRKAENLNGGRKSKVQHGEGRVGSIAAEAVDLYNSRKRSLYIKIELCSQGHLHGRPLWSDGCVGCTEALRVLTIQVMQVLIVNARVLPYYGS